MAPVTSDVASAILLVNNWAVRNRWNFVNLGLACTISAFTVVVADTAFEWKTRQFLL